MANHGENMFIALLTLDLSHLLSYLITVMSYILFRHPSIQSLNYQSTLRKKMATANLPIILSVRKTPKHSLKRTEKL